jgi:hypothetical protein
LRGRGFFLILATMTLLLSMLSIYSAYYMHIWSGGGFRDLGVSPTRIVAGDFGRALEASLIIASQKFYDEFTRSGDLARANSSATLEASKFIQQWVGNVTYAYSGFDLNVNASITLQFNWIGTGGEWYSMINGRLTINSNSLGRKVSNLNVTMGLKVERVNIFVESLPGKRFRVYMNVTAIDVYRGVGVPLDVVKIVVDGKEFYDAESYIYYGGGLNYLTILTRERDKSVDTVEGYFSYNGIIVRVFIEL